MCELKKNKEMDCIRGNCSKNLDGPLSSMESDMLVQAFQRSKERHGVEYGSVVSDGDWSLCYKLKTCVSYRQ